MAIGTKQRGFDKWVLKSNRGITTRWSRPSPAVLPRLKMTGETNLQRLLASMQPELQDGEFVFCTGLSPDIVAELKPALQFREAEGVTVIVLSQEARRLNLRYQYPCRQITLTVNSSLNAVGFLAAITTALASCKISVNPVSAFYHDHLFVPTERADEALSILIELAAKSR